MTELAQPRHGLESFLAKCAENDTATGGLEIGIRQNLAHINLRGDAGDKKFIAAARSALGQSLPVKANTMSEGTHQIYWLGPSEWLVVTDEELFASLRSALSGLHASVTDVSGGNVAMRLSGERVRDLLAKGCTLDFHVTVFNAGSCRQSGMAKANVLIGLQADASTFHIVVRRSFADYLALWLRHAAREYGVSFGIV